MFAKKWIVAVGALVAAVGPAIVLAQSPESRKVTYLTFSAPVQLPGFELPAGKYRFSIADPNDTRRVIEVASEDGKKTYGFFLTMPDERAKPSKEAVVMFTETAIGT